MSSHDLKRPFRLTILASHPVQYHVPLFRALAAHPRFAITVLYCGRWGVERYFDQGFGQTVAWDVDLLGGYDHRFLRNLSWRPNPSTPFGTISPQVVNLIRRDPPDALLVHGWMRATNWIAMSAAWRAGVPVWMRGESTLLHDSSPPKRLLKRAVLSQLFPRVDLFLAIGQRNQEFYEAWGVSADRVVLVPYAADNNFFMGRAQPEAEVRRRIRRESGLPEDVPLVLVSGKLIARKRPLDVLEACALVGRRAAVSLAYVGDGIERAAIERRARQLGFSRVVFLGVQNQSALPTLYSAADLLVLPSDFEPWGMVINEAMCCGLPVVASDKVGAAADLLADGVNGFVYPMGDVPALADRVLRIVSDDSLRRAMARESVRRIAEWSVDSGVDALVRRIALRIGDRAVAR